MEPFCTYSSIIQDIVVVLVNPYAKELFQNLTYTRVGTV